MKPFEGGKRVKEFQLPDWKARTMGRLAALSEQQAKAGRLVLLVDEQGNDLTERGGPTLGEIDRVLAALTAAEQVAVYDALLPGLGGHMARTLELIRRAPYLPNYGCMPFRADVQHNSFTVGNRLGWLISIVTLLSPYQRDAAWVAPWAAHLAGWDSEIAAHLGYLLAGVREGGGEEGETVSAILRASANNEHEIGHMGRHVIVGLLMANREDGWSFVEQLLLSAQREEGLRQSILGIVHFAPVAAFKRFMRVMLREDLVRISSTGQAVCWWFRFYWDSACTGIFRQSVETALRFLDDADARHAALRGDDPAELYLALWAQAVVEEPPPADLSVAKLLANPKPELRFVTYWHLASTDHSSGDKALLDAVGDPHDRIAALAARSFQQGRRNLPADNSVFERLETLLSRAPAKPAQLAALVWPWTGDEWSKAQCLKGMVNNLGARSPARLLPHLPLCGVAERQWLAEKFREQPDKADPQVRRALLDFTADASAEVRKPALAGLDACVPLNADELAFLEALLRREAGDLRHGVMSVLLRHPDEAVLAAAGRLLAAKPAPMRLAGLELLRRLVEAKRSVGAAKRLGEEAAGRLARPTTAEQQHLEVIRGARTEEVSMADALGLAPDSQLSPPLEPQARPGPLATDTADRLWQSLKQLDAQHATETVPVEDWQGVLQPRPISWAMRSVPKEAEQIAAAEAKFPLAEVWRKWLGDRGAELRDADGHELLRLMARKLGRELITLVPEKIPAAEIARLNAVYGAGWQEKERPHPGHLVNLVSWLLLWSEQPADYVSFVIDGFEATLAMERERAFDGSVGAGAYGWLEVARLMRRMKPADWQAEHHRRLWGLLRWRNEDAKQRISPNPPPETSRDDQPGYDKFLAALQSRFVHASSRPKLNDLTAALCVGAATEADACALLLVGHQASCGIFPRGWYPDLADLTARRPHRALSECPALRGIVDRCRERLLEVELARGEAPTPATEACLALGSVVGARTLVNLLRAVGARPLDRNFNYERRDRETVFSHLIRRCFPAETDTPATFAQLAAAADLAEQRLVDVAVFAPQWARHIEAALGWPCLAEGVAWVHAHTKNADWDADSEVKDAWKADAALHSPLTADDLLDGAVDVAWFRRIHAALGPQHWAVLDEAAKYASGGSGHARARLFADAMLGKVTKKELLTRINGKRNQDALRALGLLALAKAKPVKTAKRSAAPPASPTDEDLLSRYQVVMDFLRTSRQFGSQRQASEKRAAQIALDNLARTAGYPDPLRLQWAMEARAVEDLADGPLRVKHDGVSVSLGINPWGEIELAVSKDGKALADIPAKLKKQPAIVALRERRTELKRQAARIRPALEQLMVRGDALTGGELPGLMRHPLLAPMMRGLVLVGDGILGYPVHDGRALEDAAGNVEPLKAAEPVRIAHPLDLLPAAKWSAWQRDCLVRERVQPFKQVFRELYVPTKAELAEGALSRRYAGHQVQPRQALALLGARGWACHPEEGVRKTFHESGLVAWLGFLEGFFTPADVEGLTLETVQFTKRGEDRPLPLKDVPPRLFTETMRDLDLVVSVAHRAGVDPEASAASLELRASLVRETAALLMLTNVQVRDNFVHIRGQLAEYRVHLGSAVARKLPGETLFIVPVHAQHRGRLFLPFADDDPKTAELMSKVLLLARDAEIRDPSILEQLRG